MHRDGHTPEVTIEEYTQDILGRHAVTGPRYRRALWVFGLLFLAGVVGFIWRALVDGFDEREPWGYFAATVAFLLTTAGAAPLVAVTMRMVKAHWRRPMARIAELYSVVGVLTLLMFIPLLFLVPSAENRNTLWIQGDKVPNPVQIPGAPHAYVLLALALLVLSGLALLWLSTRPDRAILRARKAAVATMTGEASAPTSWLGTRKQWKVMQAGLGLVGGFFFLILVGAISLFCIDFAMALVPGWRDAIFPTFQSLNALQAGLAMVLLSLWFLRRYGGLERYIHMEHFWGASKILLALTLLWFYFWWSGFIVFWYGRQPVERSLLQLLMFGPYRYVFFLAFALCFVAPFLTLLWNGVRKSTWGPPLASAFILTGTLFDKVRLYVAAYSVEGKHIAEHALTAEMIRPTNWPDLVDVMMVVGGISGGIFLLLLAARVVPIMSLWEMAEGIRLRAVRPFLRTTVTVLGKPE
ncbi:MAG: hypothetical protein HY531_02555 [Chloroflexi bacterium]|nr:hypothetical protein [Chloroflexota bacterium]